jgi:hypothetical protein
MRTSSAAVLLASAIVLGGVGQAGCGPSADRASEAPPQGSVPAAPGATAAPAAPSAEPARTTIAGTFDAISTTAMGITGDLTVTDRALTFTREIVYQTESAGMAPASADFGAAKAGTWATLLGVPIDAIVELRRVSREEVGAQAPNGGLCARDRTTFIALAQSGGTREAPTLRIAAFRGPSPPGAATSAADLCGTFNYERKR